MAKSPGAHWPDAGGDAYLSLGHGRRRVKRRVRVHEHANGRLSLLHGPGAWRSTTPVSADGCSPETPPIPRSELLGRAPW